MSLRCVLRPQPLSGVRLFVVPQRPIHALPPSVRLPQSAVCAGPNGWCGGASGGAAGSRSTVDHGDARAASDDEDGESGELLCVCRRTYTEDPSFMVECDSDAGGCGGWFHPPCLGLAPCTAHGVETCLVVRTRETLYGTLYARGEHVDITGTFTCPACYHSRAGGGKGSCALAGAAWGGGPMPLAAPGEASPSCGGACPASAGATSGVAAGGAASPSSVAAFGGVGASVDAGSGSGSGAGYEGSRLIDAAPANNSAPPQGAVSAVTLVAASAVASATPTPSCVTPEPTQGSQRPRRTACTQAPISAFFGSCAPASVAHRPTRRSGENSVPPAPALASGSGAAGPGPGRPRGVLKRKAGPGGPCGDGGGGGDGGSLVGGCGTGTSGDGGDTAPTRCRPKRGVL